MSGILIHLFTSTLVILAIAKWIKGVEVDSVFAALLGALALALVNLLLYPVVAFLTLPFTLMSFGLFLLVVHALLFKLSAGLVSGFRVRGFLPAVYGSIILTVTDLVVKPFL